MRHLRSKPQLISWMVTALVLCTLPLRAGAQWLPSDWDLQLHAGVKLWSCSWESWVTSPKGTGVALGASRYQTVQSVAGSQESSLIPFFTLRHKDVFASMSAMMTTHFTLNDAATPGGFDVRASRQELDFNAGYYLLPGLALTAGAKKLVQTYGPDRFEWRGPILGMSASAPIGRGWAMYGNVGLGVMRVSFPFNQADADGRSSFRASYRLGEFGLAYALPWTSVRVQSLLVTAGYRAQFVSTQNYALAVTDGVGASQPNTHADLKDVTQGFVLGVIASF